MAADYDRHFTNHPLGKILREEVRSVLAPLLRDGDRILEIGCGTGDDAIWLTNKGAQVLATDGSEMMLEQLRARIRRDNIEGIQTEHWDANLGFPKNVYDPVDLVFSNFGALNCLNNLQDLATRISPNLKPGGHIVFTLMGRFCLWEMIAGLKRLRPDLILRRPRGRAIWHNAAKTPLAVTYFSPNAVKEAFTPHYQICIPRGIGVALPPTYLFPFFERHSKLSQTLQFIERYIWRWPLSWMIADHYVIVLKKMMPQPKEQREINDYSF